MTIAGKVADAPGQIADSLPVNAIAALLLAAYLLAVVVQCNATQLGRELYTDMFGSGSQRPFWRWALAFTVLAALANIPSLHKLFGPGFLMAVAAMLIQQAERGRLGTLNNSIRQLFGYSTTRTS